MKTVNNSRSDAEHITDKTDVPYDVSVLVATYHPSMEKLLVTLRSILIQRGVKVQIVITDDGSGDDLDIEEIRAFFRKNAFSDYEITQLEKNEGIVNNVLNGLKYCLGEFVKPISPGDYLYGENILTEWITGMRDHNCVVGFADDICYRYEGDELRPVSIQTHPQKNHDFYRNSWSYNYLIFDDPARGAATIVRADTLRKYLSGIKGKVVYAEENAYRLMAGAGERAFFLGKGAILYELGTGISTNGDSEWAKKIRDDWYAADEIMLSDDYIPNKALRDAFKLRTAAKRETGAVKGRIKMLRIPGKLRSILDHRIHTRYTETDIDTDYVKKIHEI